MLPTSQALLRPGTAYALCSREAVQPRLRHHHAPAMVTRSMVERHLSLHP
jgi:hypothetical protein